MVVADQLLDIHCAPARLLTVHVANQRLFAGCIFLAHVASLRQTFYFARLKFREFLHSFYGLDGKQIAQLTKGDWEVNRVDGLDEAKGIIYFTSTEKSPIERHLYRVSLD